MCNASGKADAMQVERLKTEDEPDAAHFVSLIIARRA